MAAITSILVATGLGLAAGGSYLSYQAAQDAASANSGIARQEMLAEKERMRAMELDARRRQLETIRNAQKSRALSLTAATSQNAQFGSGLSGGYGQIAGDSGTNLLGITQNLAIGRNLFDINQLISMYKMQVAQAGGTTALGSGLTSLGGSFMTAGSTFGNLTRGYSPYGAGGTNQTYPQFLSSLGPRATGGIY